MSAGMPRPAKPQQLVANEQGDHTFFFYGTLCHPAILTRVLNRSSDGLLFQDALLPDYTRHHVKGADYPALVGKSDTAKLLDQEPGYVLVADDSNCRGTLVSGLTYEDVQALDIFEGMEYSRTKIDVLPLTEPVSRSQAPQEMFHLDERRPVDSAQAGRMAHSLRSKSAPTQDLNADADSESKSDVGPEGDAVSGFKAWVYVWSDPLEKLEAEPWSFTAFMKEKSHIWTGMMTDEYDDVDRHHALKTMPSVPAAASETGPGDIDGVSLHHIEAGEEDMTELPGLKMAGKPDFGKGMRKYWQFKEGNTNLNHGSYGSPPACVIARMRELSAQSEADVNLFMKRSYIPLLREARTAVARLLSGDEEDPETDAQRERNEKGDASGGIKHSAQAGEVIGGGVHLDEVVLVPNASHGVDTILWNMEWEEGDVLVTYASTYGAVTQATRFLADRNPHLSLITVPLAMPLSHESILQATETVLADVNLPAIPNYTGAPRARGKDVGRRVRMVLMDHIASVPGIVFPLDRLIALCKHYGVLSLVDAAHAIGQVPVDVKRSDPDFYVTNCHKWLYAHRGCAAMYVPMRNQRLVRSSFPTGPGYESTRYPTPGMDRAWTFAGQYDWTGTMDWSSFLSVPTAIAFRREIGGEARIRTYTRALALRGGRRLARRWKTRVMLGEQDELVASMAVMWCVILYRPEGSESGEEVELELTRQVNVEMPNVPDPEDGREQVLQLTFFEDQLFAGNAFCATYRFDGRWWVRFSAQVWNEIEDFDVLAGILEGAIEGIRAGKHKPTTANEEGDGGDGDGAAGGGAGAGAGSDAVDQTRRRPEDGPVQDS